LIDVVGDPGSALEFGEADAIVATARLPPPAASTGSILN
jgi:hypothetical protein